MSSLQDDLLLIGLEIAIDVTGEEIVYHRGDQEIELTAMQSPAPQIEDQEQTRDPSQPTLHLVAWRFPLASLEELTDAEDDTPDWIESELGDRYTVLRTEGDREWEYITPDKTWVRVTTYPDD